MEASELIGRLEAASEGSRELDYAIWSKLQGVTMTVLKIDRGFETAAYDGKLLYPDWLGAPRLTTSLDAIVALIERSNWKLYSVDASVDGRPSCFIKGPDRLWPADDESDEHFGPGWEHGRAKSLPLALCIALLRALSTQDQGDQTNGS